MVKLDFSFLNPLIVFFNRKLPAFFSFIVSKLKNFPNLTLGEQISYSSIGVGLVSIIVSMVLFVV